MTIYLSVLTGFIVTALAQQQSFNYENDLLIRLQKSKPDINRLKLLHELGKFYLTKGNEVGSRLFREK